MSKEKVQVTGDHPFAAQRRMLSEQDLRRLAEDIAANGLLYPITLDPDGLVLDGRNRLAACGIAGVEPAFEVYEGDALVRVLSAEDRRHSSLPQLAAENALILAKAGKRKGGRWERGSVPDTKESLNKGTWQVTMSHAGFILDHLGEAALEAVRDNGASLDSVYQEAKKVKAKMGRLDELPKDLRALVDAKELSIGDAERRAALSEGYEARVAAGELSLDEAETLDQQEQKDLREADERAVNRIRSFLHGWDEALKFHMNTRCEQVLELLDPYDRERFVPIQNKLRRLKWPSE